MSRVLLALIMVKLATQISVLHVQQGMTSMIQSKINVCRNALLHIMPLLTIGVCLAMKIAFNVKVNPLLVQHAIQTQNSASSLMRNVSRNAQMALDLRMESAISVNIPALNAQPHPIFV